MTGADRLIKDIKDFITFDTMVRKMGSSFANNLARYHPEIRRIAWQWGAFWEHEDNASGGAER